MKFHMLIKTKITANRKFLALSLSGVVFIKLINNKIVGMFNIYEQDKFRAKLSWVWKVL